MSFRIFVEKKVGFNVSAQVLLKELQVNFPKLDLKDLRIINTYDICTSDPALEERIRSNIFGVFAEINTDNIFYDLDFIADYSLVSRCLLPGQFDQRADSAKQLLNLTLSNSSEFDVLYSELFLFPNNLSSDAIAQLNQFLVNPIESCNKNLNIIGIDNDINIESVLNIENFINLNASALEQLHQEKGLSMTLADLKHIQNYFISKERNPTETELKVIDTYWSDHCRHTTFETKINTVSFANDSYSKILEVSYKNYLARRSEYYAGKEEPHVSLMNLATLGGKLLYKRGYLSDLDISLENNACSIEIDVDFLDASKEKWLLMFKNETHNHPTEIEPFGGAATCLGGAIRDPLSGRAYVHQAIRITGASNPLTPLEKTMKGKLPQKQICQKAALGYSSYGNQIGVATGHVAEIYHQNYVAKRMEVGAVVGAVKKDWVRREVPSANDLILLIGGRTGRDGCGGATGSSRSHDDQSIMACGAEVQKGNAPEERKLLRLFRKPEVLKLIKKCNDFGAGGVCVAIGELADGVDINLDLIKTKYAGLNGTELAISESQERLALIIEAKDEAEFLTYCAEFDVEATVVGKVTEERILRMSYCGQDIVHIERSFLDTNGVLNQVDIVFPETDISNIFSAPEFSKSNLEDLLKSLNCASQKGLGEMFDSTVGAGTVLLPFGGERQLTPNEVSIMKIPVEVDKTTLTASAITWGFDPFLSSNSTYHGAYYAVIDSLAKLVAAGVQLVDIRLSFQEYFQRLGLDKNKWSLPLGALLAAFDAQLAFSTPAIGGKDSMSGSFEDIDVPPTLISFAVAKLDINQVVSNEFKAAKEEIFLLKHNPLDNFLPNPEELKKNFKFVNALTQVNLLTTSMAAKASGLFETLFKMAVGNNLGFKVGALDKEFMQLASGSIVISTTPDKKDQLLTLAQEQGINLTYLGTTHAEPTLTLTTLDTNKQESFVLEDLVKSWTSTLEPVFASKTADVEEIKEYKFILKDNPILHSTATIAKPKALIIAFYGSNCEYDCQRSLINAGADAEIFFFKCLNADLLQQSLLALATKIAQSQILVFPGGFSFGDEPDGSGKYIAQVIQNPIISEQINELIARDGLILGICNGFQALIKSGLLPYGEIGKLYEHTPTLTYNNIGRHISVMANTQLISNRSPWLNSENVGGIFNISMSHGEGRFVTNAEHFQTLVANDQIALVYCDKDGVANNSYSTNPNGSDYAIEAICSPDGRILGKMGHVERYSLGAFKNMPLDNKLLNIFVNGVNYFK